MRGIMFWAFLACACSSSAEVRQSVHFVGPEGGAGSSGATGTTSADAGPTMLDSGVAGASVLPPPIAYKCGDAEPCQDFGADCDNRNCNTLQDRVGQLNLDLQTICLDQAPCVGDSGHLCPGRAKFCSFECDGAGVDKQPGKPYCEYVGGDCIDGWCIPR